MRIGERRRPDRLAPAPEGVRQATPGKGQAPDGFLLQTWGGSKEESGEGSAGKDSASRLPRARAAAGDPIRLPFGRPAQDATRSGSPTPDFCRRDRAI